MPTMNARYGHTNLVARDWRRLAAFYTADGRHVTWCYVTDPEGNIVELQAWSD